MMTRGGLLVAVVCVSLFPHSALSDPDPTQGSVEQAVGRYANGSLIQPDSLPSEGPGFVHLFRPRDRGWGTYDIIQVIQRVASSMRDRFPAGERLQVGDVAQKGGGRMSGHDSHQNGLDADIAYFRLSREEQDPEATDGFEEEFVRDGKVTANFDFERNWALVRSWVATGRINRIFVDSAIKLAICAYAKSRDDYSARDSETLRRLRPWPNHKDHMHLRITCPDRSPRCEAQAEPPAGDGCDAASFIQYDLEDQGP